jgi:arginyl-tRNA synthetase
MQLPPSVERAVPVAPGFINFHLTPQYFLSVADKINQLGDDYGKSESDNTKKIMFEFGTPNTHKVPHIGHLYSYFYGESAVRLLEHSGYTVFRENYQGDVGLHVAKCLWAYMKNGQPEPEALAEQVDCLQRCYQEGSQAYDENEAVKAEIDELNGKIYSEEPEIKAIWEKTRSWSVAYYKQFEERIGTHFDRYYYESETSRIGKETVEANIPEIFERDAGAVVFRGEQYGLHTRVFVNKLGNPTYEGKDIGLVALKRQEFPFDLAIITTAVEQNDYWRVLTKAANLVFPDTEGKIQHIGFGMINLTTGKMSSRTGQIITAFSLIEMTKERVKQYISETRDYTAQEIEQIAEIVAIGAIKYSFLKSTAGKNITFDLESSIAFDGNSGPYLQYTYARCKSILAKAGEIDKTFVMDNPTVTTLAPEELAVLRWLSRFDEIVEQSAKQYAPHYLCVYLFELAQKYSTFYNEHQVITDDAEIKSFRLQLTQATATVLKNGLNLLGIEVSEKI